MVRTLLTLRVVSPDNCKTVDTGFQISTSAFDAAAQPTGAQANAARPPFCAFFGGEGTMKPLTRFCQQPYVRNYFALPGEGTHFQVGRGRGGRGRGARAAGRAPTPLPISPALWHRPAGLGAGRTRA
jgi:hypothetical protein